MTLGYLREGGVSQYDEGVHPRVSTISFEGNVSSERIVQFLEGDRFPRAIKIEMIASQQLDFEELANQGMVMENIVTVRIRRCDPVRLEGIDRVFPKMLELGLWSSRPVSLGALGLCQDLSRFDCNNNAFISDLNGLEFCRSLETVRCVNTGVKNVEWLLEFFPDLVVHFGGRCEPVNPA